MRLSGIGYLGRFQLGQEIPLTLWVRDRDRVPSWPDASPLARIVDSAGEHIQSVKMPAVDRHVVTGYFQYLLPIEATYSVGNYTVEYQFSVSGYSGLLLSSFDVVAGGDAAGPVIALHAVHRPEARYIVAHLGTGRLVVGRNPTVQ